MNQPPTRLQISTLCSNGARTTREISQKFTKLRTLTNDANLLGHITELEALVGEQTAQRRTRLGWISEALQQLRLDVATAEFDRWCLRNERDAAWKKLGDGPVGGCG